MNVFMRSMLQVAAVAIAMGIVTAATAQGWSIKVGVNQITPKVKSDDMTAPTLPHTKVDVGANTQPIISAIYNYTDNVSAELVLGAPYKHTLYGAGSVAGVGKTGTVDAMPPTVFAQYRFRDGQAKFRPYLGLGLTYAYFRNETGSAALTALTNTGSATPTTFSVDPAWGLSSQIGATCDLSDKWFVDISATKTLLKTTAHFSTGQTILLHLDPVSVAAAVGYRF
jgi:outer membrane protein